MPSGSEDATKASTDTAATAPRLHSPLGQPRRFAALRNRWSRWFLVGSMTGMMGDNIEHVISYWVMWERFHSPLLAGFAVVSHWVPHLFFSVYFGGLADKYDCRRIIQAGMALFALVSVGWGVFFFTDLLQEWHCMLLLVLHGFASVMWQSASQLILHDIVGGTELASAIRLNSTLQTFGMLVGPAVGAVLLIWLGPAVGIIANGVFFVPMFLVLVFLPFTGHIRDGGMNKARTGLRDSLMVLREVRSSPGIVSMIILAGAIAVFFGTVLGVVMPEFAQDLVGDDGGIVYGMLLTAHAAGSVVGGLVLESFRFLRPTIRLAIWATVILGISTLVFAFSGNVALSLVMLFIGGGANLASRATGQTIVQLMAPAGMRGRVIGVYGMAAGGLRAGSGLVALAGGLIGIHLALMGSSVLLCLFAIGTMLYVRGRNVRITSDLY